MKAPVRRPPLRTEDVKRLLLGVDEFVKHAVYMGGQSPLSIEGYAEVAAAVGHEPAVEAPPAVLKCTQCGKVITGEPVYGEFCSTACQDKAWEDAKPTLG